MYFRACLLFSRNKSLTRFWWAWLICSWRSTLTSLVSLQKPHLNCSEMSWTDLEKKQDWLWPQLGKKQGEYWENALSGQKWFLDQLWAFCLFDMFKNKADCFNEPAMFLDTREAFVGNFTKSTLVRLVDGRWQLLLRFLLLGFGLSGKLHLRDLQSCDYDKHWNNFKSKKLLYEYCN